MVKEKLVSLGIGELAAGWRAADEAAGDTKLIECMTDGEGCTASAEDEGIVLHVV